MEVKQSGYGQIAANPAAGTAVQTTNTNGSAAPGQEGSSTTVDQSVDQQALLESAEGGAAAGAGRDSGAASDSHIGPFETEAIDTNSSLLPQVDPCKQYDDRYDSWLDKSQVGIYRTVCGATAWFDGFFGDRRFDQATGNTYGRITVGGFWDERDGWDSRVRFRARFALPSLRERGALLIGRGDEQDLIEERNTSGGEPVSTPPRNGEEDSTFIGLGFDALRTLSRSFSVSVGAKLRMPPEPIVKLKYRRAWQLSERNLLRLRPIAYWKSEGGFGTTVNLDLDHVINTAFLFRWANFGNVSEEEEVEGVDWGSTLYLFQALSNKRAITYSAFARGETDAPVTFKNAGIEFRYRQRILRDWLFIEYNGSLSWPRYMPEEERKANFGSGLRIEAYFGPAPDDFMR